MGWRVDPRLVRSCSNLESHRDQTGVVGDIVAYTKLLVFRQVRDRLSGPKGFVDFVYIVDRVQDGTF